MSHLQLPHYDEHLDHLLDHVIHRVMQIFKEDGPNYTYRNLLRIVNYTSSVLARQKYQGKRRIQADDLMDWQTSLQ